MATTRSFLLIPATLGLLLVLASAEQGKTTTTLLVIHGKALCKSNSSRIISNAPVQLVINNATVPGGTGRTTIDGHILMTVNLNSTELLAALMSNGSSSKAYVIAPRHACGVPSLPSGKEVAAEVHPMAMMTISDHDDGGSSLQRPTIATADRLLVPAVNGSLHATRNKGDDVVHVVFAALEKFVCVAIFGSVVG